MDNKLEQNNETIFDSSRVYTALNADESLIGSAGYFCDNIVGLKGYVRLGNHAYLEKLDRLTSDNVISPTGHFEFFYLIDRPWYVINHEEDGFVITQKSPGDYLSECIPFSDKTETTEFQLWWGRGTKKECEDWIKEHSKWYVLEKNGECWVSDREPNDFYHEDRASIIFKGTKEECDEYEYNLEKDKECRPFKDSKELIEVYLNRLYGKDRKSQSNMERPVIWITMPDSESEYQITTFKRESVYIETGRINLDFLTKYTFLDGSPCGVMPSEEKF